MVGDPGDPRPQLEISDGSWHHSWAPVGADRNPTPEPGIVRSMWQLRQQSDSLRR